MVQWAHVAMVTITVGHGYQVENIVDDFVTEAYRAPSSTTKATQWEESFLVIT